MDLGKYIVELLQSHECVVLPGLGGFITRHEGATIHPGQNLCTPPTRTVLFNDQLVNNDGLLAHYIADKEQIDYDVALQSLMFQINELLFTLYKKQVVELTSIGKITMNGNRLQFQSEMGLNLQDENYGLTSFIFPLIQREQIIQPKPVEPIFVNTTSKPPIRKYVGIAASIVVLLGCFTYFLLHQSHSNLNLSRLFPELSWNAPTTTNQPTTIENNNFLSIAPCDFLDSLINIAARDQQDQSIPEKENQPTIINDSTLSDFEQKSNDNQNVEQESPTVFEQPQEPISKKYYIIGASYELRINAEERCNELKASGFQAEVLDAPKIGRFRVSYGCFTSRKESESFLEEVRKNYRPDAWLFIVKQ